MLPTVEWQYNDHVIFVRAEAEVDDDEWQALDQLLRWMLDQGRPSTHVILDLRRLPAKGAEKALRRMDWQQHPRCGWILHLSDSTPPAGLPPQIQACPSPEAALQFLLAQDPALQQYSGRLSAPAGRRQHPWQPG